MDTSEGNTFRLLFLVNYATEDGQTLEEKILSRSFAVYSNRKKNIKEKPTVIAMMPSKGAFHAQTEVWIKGRGFTDKGIIPSILP